MVVPCVHFSCHGQNPHDVSLLLEHAANDHDGQLGLAHSVKAKVFAGQLKNHDGAKVIEFVFVSACHSLEVGKKFAEFGIKHVIAVDQAHTVKDAAAQLFSKTLYRMLFSGSTVIDAFEEAKLHLSACDDIDYSGNRVVVDAENQASRFQLLGDGPHDQPLAFVAQLTAGRVHDGSAQMSRYLPKNDSFKIKPRQEEMFNLMKQMAHMQSNLLVVHGSPSIGKSSLLLECARYMSARGRRLAWIPCSDDSSPAVLPHYTESFKDSDFKSAESLCSFIGRALGCAGVRNFDELTRQHGLAKSWIIFDAADEAPPAQKALLFAKNGLVASLCAHFRVCHMVLFVQSFFSVWTLYFLRHVFLISLIIRIHSVSLRASRALILAF
jgi:hypothetical protein